MLAQAGSGSTSKMKVLFERSGEIDAKLLAGSLRGPDRPSALLVGRAGSLEGVTGTEQRGGSTTRLCPPWGLVGCGR